jgi:hypothetical protein
MSELFLKNNTAPVKFIDYWFSLTSDGSIVLDEELTPDVLNVKQGDQFEVVIVPGIGVVLKKIKKSDS